MALRLVCVVVVVAAALLHQTSAGFWTWIRGADPEEDYGHHVGEVQIEVLSPRGIRLWTAYNPNTALFGVELYVRYYGGKTEALECALCQNVTEPIDGKFLLEDDSLVARFADILQYFIITSNGTTTKRHAVRRVVVQERIIKPNDRCVCRGRVNYLAPLADVPVSEVELLERMILRAVTYRSGGSCAAISNWLVLRVEPRQELSDPLEYVRNYLDRAVLKVKWCSVNGGGASSNRSVWTDDVRPSALIVRAEDHVHGIAFQEPVIGSAVVVVVLAGVVGTKRGGVGTVVRRNHGGTLGIVARHTAVRKANLVGRIEKVARLQDDFRVAHDKLAVHQVGRVERHIGRRTERVVDGHLHGKVLGGTVRTRYRHFHALGIVHDEVHHERRRVVMMPVMVTVVMVLSTTAVPAMAAGFSTDRQHNEQRTKPKGSTPERFQPFTWMALQVIGVMK
uniref:CBM39 domain-containing protein n=1 Tax=Anopheles farauti TaxID=69004 RepID=A0A182Q9J7_9DIPT